MVFCGTAISGEYMWQRNGCAEVVLFASKESPLVHCHTSSFAGAGQHGTDVGKAKSVQPESDFQI